jgi:hypothetical protein
MGFFMQKNAPQSGGAIYKAVNRGHGNRNINKTQKGK